MSGEPANLPEAAAAVIAVDLPCIRCRYNLRSLKRDSVCPECSTPVENTLQRGWLEFADRDWLRRLRTGVTTALWTVLFGFVCWIGFFAFLSLSPTGAPPVKEITAVTFAIGLAFNVVWLVCLWHLTAREPKPDANRTTNLSFWIRALAVESLLLFFVWVLLFDPFKTDGLIGGVPAILCSAVTTLTGAILMLLLLIHLRRIARRSHSAGLGKLLNILLWGAVAWMPLWIVATGFAFVTVGRLAGVGTAGLAATTTVAGTAATAPASLATIGYVSALPATVPAGAAVAAPPRPAPPAFLRGGNFALMLMGVCLFDLVALAWLVGGIVALFWFRRVLTRAIENPVRDMWACPAVPAPPQGT